MDIDGLDTFTRAYMICALWSTNDESTPSGGVPLDDNYGLENISEETAAVMIADCEKFQAENKDDIDGRDSQAGHDFWLTRNGHGAGFWEKSDWPEEPGRRMTDASKAFGEFNLYVENGVIGHD